MDKYATKVMAAIKRRCDESGLSLDVLGQRMGYKSESARKSAWQFLNKTTDPRLSMLKKVADALELDVKDLLDDQPTGGR